MKWIQAISCYGFEDSNVDVHAKPDSSRTYYPSSGPVPFLNSGCFNRDSVEPSSQKVEKRFCIIALGSDLQPSLSEGKLPFDAETCCFIVEKLS